MRAQLQRQEAMPTGQCNIHGATPNRPEPADSANRDGLSGTIPDGPKRSEGWKHDHLSQADSAEQDDS